MEDDEEESRREPNLWPLSYGTGEIHDLYAYQLQRAVADISAKNNGHAWLVCSSETSTGNDPSLLKYIASEQELVDHAGRLSANTARGTCLGVADYMLIGAALERIRAR
jgi:hypothetical protein